MGWLEFTVIIVCGLLGFIVVNAVIDGRRAKAEGQKKMTARKKQIATRRTMKGGVAELVGIEGGVVSGVINLESSGVEASDWRPRHDEQYHEV
jgi:hypothetical protein